MPPWLAVIVPVALAGAALALRLAVHTGRRPGGVDTWYHLSYADAFRRHPSLDVRLPQYLLQDERQSYPPLFPSLLAAIPSRWLSRNYWLLSPAIDCIHLLLLYTVTLRLTASTLIAAIAAGIYAFTPQLVSETRSLTPRPFAALLHSFAALVLLEYTATGRWTWAAAAVTAVSALFLCSATMAAAYTAVGAALAVIFADPRYAAVPVAGLAAAIAVSRGHMLRVVRNYALALDFWRRNRWWFGAHPVRDSPVLGGKAPGVPPLRQRDPGLLGESLPRQFIRLFGENPFLLALLWAPRLASPWSHRLYWWAIVLAALAVVATILPPLRAFGPGRGYMRAAVFPTAYTLAAGIGTPAGLTRPLGRVTLSCLLASAAAIGFFLVYVRSRPTEQTASTPAGLDAAVRTLRCLPPGGVFVLPYMYADYVGYWAGRPVGWGGHCGNHARWEWIAPVIRRPLDDIFADIGIRFVLLDTRYVALPELQLRGSHALVHSADGFEVYECGAAAATAGGLTPTPR